MSFLMEHTYLGFDTPAILSLVLLIGVSAYAIWHRKSLKKTKEQAEDTLNKLTESENSMPGGTL